jgi:hypothetical protein
MIKLEFEDVYAPVGICSICSNDLLIEPCESLCQQFEAKCWACGYSSKFDLDFQEKFINRIHPQIQTWRIRRISLDCPEGLLVFGKDLFATTEKKDALLAKINSPEMNEKEKYRLQKLFEKIEDREEMIDLYFRNSEIENAYCYAANEHKCLLKDTISLMECREKVNWISKAPNGLFTDHWNLYGLILQAWKICCIEIESNRIDAQNETEIRSLFITKFSSLVQEQYEPPFNVWFGQDREIYINGKKLKPDAQFPALVAIEIKTFFNEQKYNCSSAASAIRKDLQKLEKYKEKFRVGFFLCFSQKFSKQKLMKNIRCSFSYPVRVLVCGTNHS